MPILFIIIFLVTAANADEYSRNEHPSLNLYSREVSPDYTKMMLSLNETELNWLKERKQLIVAVPVPDNPPMDITLRSGEYEGVTADILGVIEKKIGVKIIAKPFSSRSEAINAIRNGHADIIGSSNSYEVGEGLALTIPYVADEPVLYKRFGVARDKIKTLAVPESYLPFSEVIRYVPGVKVNVFPSRYSAVAAVAYGKADAVLIDMISGNFLINKYYQDTIQLDRPIYANTAGFSFGVNENNEILKSILNDVLIGIAEFNVKSVIKRWSGGGISIQSQQVQLTDAEWQWLHDKGRLKIAVSTVLPPLSFIDEQGNHHGVVSDLFQVMSAKLGVEIEPVMLSYANDEQVTALESGRVDAAMMTATEKRRQRFMFSRSFYIEPLVYVVRKGSENIEPDSFYKMGRAAIIQGLISNFDNQPFFGRATEPKYFERVESALLCVSQDNCDVTVVPLRTAKFYINSRTEFRNKLIISGELFNSIPATANFAFLPKNTILESIFDKVIATIPPDELENLATRARVSERSNVFTWQDLFREFGAEIMAIFFVLIGSCLWLLLLRRQIRHRKKAEKALGGQLKFIEELVDSMPHPIYSFDASSRLILCNQSYSSIFGVPKEALLGQSFDQLQSTFPFIEPLGIVLSQTLSDGTTREGDCQLHLNNRSVDIYHWLQVYRDMMGEVQGVVGGWIDVSDRTALLRDLANASQSAKAASNAKSTFLATMSHEIRTPMNAIIGLLELTLHKGSLHAEARESISVAYQSANDLLGLIGDILDISKIESGKLELIPSPNKIVELSRAVINVFTATARQQGLNLSLTTTTDDDLTVMIDQLRYKQILSNLVSNAIKFTRNGGVDVHLMLTPIGSSCNVQIHVTDSGIGISKQDLKLLFQPFSQVGQPVDMQKSGTGLGLMISRTLCRMMGGDLEISSELGQGTTVSLNLMLPLTEPAPSNNELPVSVPTRVSDSVLYNILIIDDHPTNRLLVGQQLEFLGHKVQAVGSATEALQCLASKSFDIIITDFNMPVMDGLELTTRYRLQESEEARERAIIIGLTADARQEQIQKAIEAGMDDCLFKPVSLEELRQCISTHITGYIDTPPIEIADDINQRLAPLTLGRTDLMKQLLAEFLRAADDDLASLIKASRESDSQAFLSSLHRLKGGARIIGADGLVACCIAWENSTRLPLCMPSALRQVQHIYQQLKVGVYYWEESSMKGD